MKYLKYESKNKKVEFLLYFVYMNTHPFGSREKRERNQMPQESTDQHCVGCFPLNNEWSLVCWIFRQNVIKSPIQRSLNTDNGQKKCNFLFFSREIILKWNWVPLLSDLPLLLLDYPLQKTNAHYIQSKPEMIRVNVMVLHTCGCSTQCYQILNYTGTFKSTVKCTDVVFFKPYNNERLWPCLTYSRQSNLHKFPERSYISK